MPMKKHLQVGYILAFFSVCFSLPTYAQSVTIDPSNVTSGHLIEAKSTKKGFLLPVMNETQRTALNTPVAGVQIYCTNCSSGAGTYTYNGLVWVPMFNTAGITYIVGQSAQGGKVFFVDDTGQHGLVVADADYSSGANVTWLSSSNAAQTTSGGYGDWYLPSQAELYKLYQVKASVGMSGSTGVYWSSTEVPVEYGLASTQANYVNFSNGAQAAAAKSNAYKVRAIRRF